MYMRLYCLQQMMPNYIDPAGIDSPDVTDYKRCLKLFTDKGKSQSHRLSDIRSYHSHM